MDQNLKIVPELFLFLFRLPAPARVPEVEDSNGRADDNVQTWDLNVSVCGRANKLIDIHDILLQHLYSAFLLEVAYSKRVRCPSVISFRCSVAYVSRCSDFGLRTLTALELLLSRSIKLS